MTTNSCNSRSSELIKEFFIISIFLWIYLNSLFHIYVPVRNPDFQTFFPTLLLLKCYAKSCVLPFLGSLKTQIPRLCSVLWKTCTPQCFMNRAKWLEIVSFLSFSPLLFTNPASKLKFFLHNHPIGQPCNFWAPAKEQAPSNTSATATVVSIISVYHTSKESMLTVLFLSSLLLLINFTTTLHKIDSYIRNRFSF